MVLFLRLLTWGAPLLCALLCCSCETSLQSDSADPPAIRAVLKSAGNGTIKAQVYVEGPDGNAVSGAVVTVRDEGNQVLSLDYDSTTCSYNSVLPERSGDARYAIEVLSRASAEPLLLTVPYTALATKPAVTVFQDADGNSVLNGQRIVAAKPVQIAWTVCNDQAVYQIALKTALQTVYATSTNAATLTIPAQTLPAGSYWLEITAQRIHGDPYFKGASYYAVSSLSSAGVSCNVE